MPAALWFLLVCDKTVVERVPPPSVSWTLALGLPMLLACAEPPAPPGAALGPGGIGFWASATPLERASAQAAIVEILSMFVPPLRVRMRRERHLRARRCMNEPLDTLHGTSLAVRRGGGQERMSPPPTLEPSHLPSLPRAWRDDGAADLRDSGPPGGAGDRPRHRRRSFDRSGTGRGLCSHRRRRGLFDDDGLRRADRPLWRHAHDPGRHGGAGRGARAAGLGLVAAVRARRLRRRAGAGDLDALEFASARSPLTAASCARS